MDIAYKNAAKKVYDGLIFYNFAHILIEVTLISQNHMDLFAKFESKLGPI